MSTTTERHRRSRLMRLLRSSPGPLLLLCAAGGVLMGFATTGGAGTGEWNQLLWGAGTSMLALGGVLFITLLWGAVYLNVVEASRGMPGLRSVEEPTMAPEPAAKLRALNRALSGLGFRHDGWFSLDDFDETHVSAWKHDSHPAAAFVLYFPMGGIFRLRFVRRFPNGGILVSSTRLTDLAIAPPQGLYVQARNKTSVEEFWAWHLEGESLFPIGPPEGDNPPAGPRELFVEVAARWARHRQRDRTWLLAVEPVEECWRIYWLRGMPLRRQFERGWTTPFWR
ncbi:MAG TPA: hypothetical protein VKE74_16340 [Gemmataceae bacterium]|nr:hypothetical protein [Gemmataceae bacterium]